MKYRNTVFWPEKNIGANEEVDPADAGAKATAEEMVARVKEGFAVELELEAPAEKPLADKPKLGK